MLLSGADESGCVERFMKEPARECLFAVSFSKTLAFASFQWTCRRIGRFIIVWECEGYVFRIG